MCNGELKAALWGTPDKLAIGIGKTDVWARCNSNAAEPECNTEKPVGQILFLSSDFTGAAQPTATTSMKNGVHSFRLTRGAAAADIMCLSSRPEKNIIAFKVACTGLSSALSFRLFRKKDTEGDVPSSPVTGSSGAYFWIRQDFPADSTFPGGFYFYLVAKVVGATPTFQSATNQLLGAAVDDGDGNMVSYPGSAITATLPLAASTTMTLYATVVTLAESSDPFAEAKTRLDAAEAAGFDALATELQTWYQALFARRELGRIFTGAFDEIKSVILPFLFQGSWQFRHTWHSSPDPTKYEGDATYVGLQQDWQQWNDLPCFNEELYTPDYVMGRNESVASYYVKLYNFWLPAFRKNAEVIGMPGWQQLRGYIPPVKPGQGHSSYFGSLYGDNTRDWGTMVYGYKNVWDDFDYGGKSDQFLADSVYPGLRDMADFFAALVKQGSDGYYHLLESQAREGDHGTDAIDCIAAVKWAFRNAILASNILGVDAAKRTDWQGKLDKMAPYGVLSNNNWAEIWVNNQPKSADVAHYPVNVADEFNLESSTAIKDRCVQSNKLTNKQPMARLVEMLLGYDRDTFHGGNWTPQVSGYFAYNQWLKYYADASGNGDFTTDLPLTTRMRKILACWLEPERLCNSRSGTIFFFPCVPSGLDIAFRDFQARGGFLVTGEIKSGAVTYASIAARRTATCAFMSPWPGQTVYVHALPENSVIQATKNGEKYTFAAQTGKTYVLTTSSGAVNVAQPSARSSMTVRYCRADTGGIVIDNARSAEVMSVNGALVARGSAGAVGRLAIRAALRPGIHLVVVQGADGPRTERVVLK